MKNYGVRTTQHGFTLLELMVTVAIAALLLTVAVPSFSQMIRGSRTTSHANELLGAMIIGRSEAMKRRQIVSVCARATPATSPETCAIGNSWAGGWLVYTDSGTAGLLDGTDELLKVGQPMKSLSATATASYASYRYAGEAKTPLTVTLIPSGCTADQALSLNLVASGRAVLSPIACS